MQDVWLLFKMIEVVMGIICVITHVIGFTYRVEPLSHNLLYCGTFVGFSLISLLSAITIILGNNALPVVEAVTTVCASIAHYGAAMVTMYDTEHDAHLMYLTDFEEPDHPYFKYGSRQSISALVAGAFYTMHAVLALDAVCMGTATHAMAHIDVLNDLAPRKPIRLYVGGAWLHNKLENCSPWFRRLAAR